MSRPALYGSQLVMNGKNFVGINIGYNFKTEHENGTLDLVYSLNRPFLYSEKQLNKLRRENNRFRNTPFGDYMLLPNVPILRRDIIIDNSVLVGRYRNILLKDGDYSILFLGDEYSKTWWSSSYGKRRKFNESEFMYMPDYNSPNNALWYTAGSFCNSICGAWDSNTAFIFVSKELSQKVGVDIISCIESSLKAGHLACVPMERRLFKDRGCCFVDVEMAYFGRRSVNGVSEVKI